MRIYLIMFLCLLIIGCSDLKFTELKYQPNTYLGGYKDIKVSQNNHCKALYIATMPYEKKLDLGYLRVLEACYLQGFKYFELVGIEKRREEEINEYDKQIIYSPIIEIAAYIDNAAGREEIQSYAEAIKFRNKLEEPVF